MDFFLGEVLNNGKNLEDYLYLFSYLRYMISRHDILSKLKELKPALYKDYYVKEIGLFGSFGDETFSEDSDIDLVVELERPIGWRFFSLELYLQKIFDRKIDLVSKNALKEQIKDSILKKVDFV